MYYHKENIILIGMSGAGKSTLGKLLAQTLEKNFIDTDILIQRQENRLLQEIIDTDGTDAFLKIEESVVSGLSVKNSVIATGGSVVYSDIAMKALKRNGEIVYLYVPYDELECRLTDITTRGIVIKKGNSLRDVYEERQPLYRQYSDCIIDCSGMDIESCVRSIRNKLGYLSEHDTLANPVP